MKSISNIVTIVEKIVPMVPTYKLWAMTDLILLTVSVETAPEAFVRQLIEETLCVEGTTPEQRGQVHTTVMAIVAE